MKNIVVRRAKVPLWYVLTGGPSSGKTTLLNELGKLGYYTVPEAARRIIDDNIANGISSGELRKDAAAFQKQVLELKLKTERKTPKSRIVFFDRGVPDSMAYYEFLNLDMHGLKKLAKDRYRRVFFLEQLPYKKDYARTESKKMASNISRLLFRAYKNLGYSIVSLPAVPVEERLSLVLANL